MRKITTLLLPMLCSILFSNAQFFKPSVKDDNFNDSLSRIVYEFKTNFYPIQAKQLTSEGLVDVFESSVKIPGAAHCIIQRYHSEEDTTASWQAIMYDGDSFDEAAKIYKNTYRLIKKSKIKYGTSINYSFTGSMEAPSEEIRFTVSPLRLNTSDKDYEHFYAEVEITSNFPNWEVHLNMHSKKNDNEKY
ncbi:hypothetical protein BH11BAC3_BH11BAC3_28270 [soil metagenome]